MSKLRAVIDYFVKRLSDAGVSPTRTRVMKLVYLADVVSYQEQGESLTDVDWVFLHYGPYAAEVTESLEELAQEGAVARTTDEEDYGEASFVSYWARDPRLLEEARGALELAEVLMLQDTFRDWGQVGLNELLDHVYFETAPMQAAERFEHLDMTLSRTQPCESLEPVHDETHVRRLAEALRGRERTEPQTHLSVPFDVDDLDFGEDETPRHFPRELRGKRVSVSAANIKRLADAFGRREP